MPNLKGRAKEGVRYTWIFPNITFAANRDALWCYEAYPLGSEKCKVVQTACFHPKSVSRIEFKSKLQAYLHRLDAALEEDIPALVNQQVGIKNPDAVQGSFKRTLRQMLRLANHSQQLVIFIIFTQTKIFKYCRFNVF